VLNNFSIGLNVEFQGGGIKEHVGQGRAITVAQIVEVISGIPDGPTNSCRML
jgi:hypothetical protein